MANPSQATEVQTCAECGRPVPADAQTLGLCPRCLMHSAVRPGDDAEDGDPSASPRDFIAPSPEELAAEFTELEILELLGRGGMGAVYKARQIGLDRLVAVKIFPLDAAAPDAPPASGSGGSATGNFPERFRHEARLLARLSHPHIVAAHQAGQTANYCYLVMEYVPGPNLREVLHRGPLPPAEAVRVALQVCDALEYAHGQGVVHRDVKPENILLQGDAAGRVRVADFGLARLLDHRSPWMGMTVEGHRLGTPYYMAPEQSRPGAPVDARADVYAAGVLLYEMLTGELPIGRFAAPSQKVHETGRGGGWPLGERIDWVVLRCLEPDPRLRFQTVAELKRELAEALAKPAPPAPRLPSQPLPTQALPPQPLPMSPPVPVGPLEYQPTIPDSIHPAYRRRLALRAAAIGAVAMVALLVGGAVVAALLYRARGRRNLPATVATTLPAATQPAVVGPPRPPFPRMAQQPWPPGFGPRINAPFGPAYTGPEDWLQRMTEQHGRDRVVTLRIDGLPGDVTSHIRERLQATVRPANIFSTSSADTLTVHMAPVGDVQSVADKIDFGTVQGVDAGAKVVRVKADPAKLPAPLPPAVTNPRDAQFYPRNLEDLDSWDAGRRRESAQRLRDAPPATGDLRASIAAALRRRLKEDADAHTRSAAAAALATWTQPENAQALVDALKDSEWVVRRGVLEALGKLKDPTTAPAVAAMLPESRHDAAAALKAMGPAAEGAVLPYLKHADHWVRMEAANVLGDIGTDKSLPALRELSESRDGLAPGAAKQAIEAIRKRSGGAE